MPPFYVKQYLKHKYKYNECPGLYSIIEPSWNTVTKPGYGYMVVLLNFYSLLYTQYFITSVRYYKYYASLKYIIHQYSWEPEAM